DRNVTGVQTCALPILLEKFQPFRADAEFEVHETGGVTAGPGQVLDQSERDRIADVDEYDRCCARRLVQWQRGSIARGHENIRSRSEERRVGKECREQG